MDFGNILGRNFGKGNNWLLILLLLLIVIPSLSGSGANPSGGNLVYFSPNVAGAGTDGCNQFGFFNKYSSQSGLGGNVLFIILILALLLLLGQRSSNEEDSV
ncbi:hypothetical protein FDN13_04700 [Caloramator sp. E03]|uniref:hypothetical protein n=1 Tax=Caloramator sp. E03 TaxID=2576307 RepID=UPI001110FAB6|nr:hypothetical protein [Caloramator sp. E03]QCX33066.1 hypothetical protein FDN13_04700 [Caloramator sp. E03]